MPFVIALPHKTQVKTMVSALLKNKKIRALALAAIALALCLGIFALLLWNGIVLLNNPSDEKYPVKGVDVSSYQGDIDWQTLARQNIQFAFIKATEGSQFVDPHFSYNFSEAMKTNLRIGAYHFFSYDSSGKTQAAHFMATVPNTENMLPPVIDVEFYGDKERHLPDPAAVEKELAVMLTELEDHYGVKPIIYATEKSYGLYIQPSFPENDLWIRNVVSKPHIPSENPWVFWQYTNRNRLSGYAGKERFIDMNVFYGSQDDFDNYGM